MDFMEGYEEQESIYFFYEWYDYANQNALMRDLGELFDRYDFACRPLSKILNYCHKLKMDKLRERIQEK
jgi:hypothetical protein